MESTNLISKSNDWSWNVLSYEKRKKKKFALRFILIFVKKKKMHINVELIKFALFPKPLPESHQN